MENPAQSRVKRRDAIICNRCCHVAGAEEGASLPSHRQEAETLRLQKLLHAGSMAERRTGREVRQGVRGFHTGRRYIQVKVGHHLAGWRRSTGRALKARPQAESIVNMYRATNPALTVEQSQHQRLFVSFSTTIWFSLLISRSFRHYLSHGELGKGWLICYTASCPAQIRVKAGVGHIQVAVHVIILVSVVMTTGWTWSAFGVVSLRDKKILIA